MTRPINLVSAQVFSIGEFPQVLNAEKHADRYTTTKEKQENIFLKSHFLLKFNVFYFFYFLHYLPKKYPQRKFSATTQDRNRTKNRKTQISIT